MFFRTKSNSLFEREYQDNREVEVDLRHLNSMNLTDSEIEFLQMKRSKYKHSINRTPDPRLGEYET